MGDRDCWPEVRTAYCVLRARTYTVEPQGPSEASVRSSQHAARSGLQKGNRIPIDHDPHVIRIRNLEALEKETQNARERSGVIRLEQEVPTPATLNPVDGTWGRADHGDGKVGCAVNQLP